jgi:hypothetical protein
MVPGVAVESHLRVLRTYFPDPPGGAQKIQVPVHGPQADVGYTLAHHFVDLVSSGMRAALLDYFQYNPPLSGHAMPGRFAHHTSFIDNCY